MNLPEIPSLPFLTRDMFRFGRTAAIRLRVRVMANTPIDVLIKFATREGISEHLARYTGTGVVQTFNIGISEIPIFLSAVTETASIKQGDCYVSVDLQINQETVLTMCSGYVYNLHSISWPQTNNPDIIPGRGGIRFQNGEDPAAGVEIQDAVPAGQLWRLLSVRLQLVTDANVANRRVHLVTDNNSFTGVDIFGDQDQAASLTRNYTFACFGSIPDTLDDNDILVNIPNDIYILGSGFIITQTTNLQAGDNFSNATYCIEQLYTEEL